MKNIYKEWITSLIGVAFIILAGMVYWYKGDITLTIGGLGIGIAALFAKDKFIKVLINKYNKL